MCGHHMLHVFFAVEIRGYTGLGTCSRQPERSSQASLLCKCERCRRAGHDCGTPTPPGCRRRACHAKPATLDPGPSSVPLVALPSPRHPNLLCCSPASLTSKLAALEAAFALPHARAVLLAVEWPALLTMSEERIKVGPCLGVFRGLEDACSQSDVNIMCLNVSRD